MVLTPVQQSSLSETCYTRIKDAILRLDILPGTPLVETQLADQLGTSKSPVREALLRLASEELVLPAQGRTSVVAGLTIEKIRDWYGLRCILEPASLAAVASELTEPQLNGLWRTHHETVEAFERDDMVAFVYGNESLHTQLIRFNPNRTLVKLVEQLLEQIRRVRVALYDLDRREYWDEGPQFGTRHHAEIIQALVDHHVDVAQDVLRMDIEAFLNRLDLPDVRAALEATQFPSKPLRAKMPSSI